MSPRVFGSARLRQPRGLDSARSSIRRVAVAGALAGTLVAVGLAGCGAGGTGLGRLTVDGQVQVTSVHGAAHGARSGEVLRSGDIVTVSSGAAAVRLLPGGQLQLRPGTQLDVDKTSRLLSGAVLIQPAGRPVRVSALASTLVVTTGVAQLAIGSPTAGLTAKVYQATAELDIAGNPPAAIAAPREVRLTPQTLLPVQPTPLQYQDSDPWDHLYLADAELISTQLSAAATGLNAQVPASQGKDPAFYQQLLPSLSGQPDFAGAFQIVQRQQPAGGGGGSKPGDYLIASVIAMRGSRGSFESRLSAEMSFFSQGAPWGFVAYDQGVLDLTGVLNDVLAGINRATLPVSGAPASQIALGPPATTAPTPTTRPSRPTQSVTTTTTTPANPRQPHPPVPPTTTTTAPQPLIQLPVPVLPGVLGSLLNPLIDPLIQALNNLLGGGKH
jgi:hypothetical protein